MSLPARRQEEATTDDNDRGTNQHREAPHAEEAEGSVSLSSAHAKPEKAESSTIAAKSQTSSRSSSSSSGTLSTSQPLSDARPPPGEAASATTGGGDTTNSAADAFSMPPRLVLGADEGAETASATEMAGGDAAFKVEAPPVGVANEEAVALADDEPGLGCSEEEEDLPGGPSGALKRPARVDRRSGTKRAKAQPWSEEEHVRFLMGLQKLGKGNWSAVSRYYVPTRTPAQVASHAQKHFIRLASLYQTQGGGVRKRKSRFSVLDSTCAAPLAGISGAAAYPDGTAPPPGVGGRAFKQGTEPATASGAPATLNGNKPLPQPPGAFLYSGAAAAAGPYPGPYKLGMPPPPYPAPGVPLAPRPPPAAALGVPSQAALPTSRPPRYPLPAGVAPPLPPHVAAAYPYARPFFIPGCLFRPMPFHPPATPASTLDTSLVKNPKSIAPKLQRSSHSAFNACAAATCH